MWKRMATISTQPGAADTKPDASLTEPYRWSLAISIFKDRVKSNLAFTGIFHHQNADGAASAKVALADTAVCMIASVDQLLLLVMRKRFH